jgi:flagellar hook-associated protein 3 FlgL
MAIERVGTFATTQVLLSQLQRAENNLNVTEQQVSSGKLADTYTGYGDKTALMEAARSSADRADANVAAAQQASVRLDLQDSLLSQLGEIAQNVRETLTKAAADQDATSLMTTLQGYFAQAVQILNSKDANGYIFAGDNNQTPPVTVTDLASLGSIGSVSNAFNNGSVKTSVRIGDNQTVQVGLLASDIGTQLFSLFQQVQQFDSGVSGPFDAKTSASQQSFLEGTIQTAGDAAANVNAEAAGNGIRYKLVQDSISQLQSTSTVYKGFVSNLQDVDVAEALSKLQQNQVALQAAFKMSSTLNQDSLLNYI